MLIIFLDNFESSLIVDSQIAMTSKVLLVSLSKY